eukprot:EG_transcript_15671
MSYYAALFATIVLTIVLAYQAADLPSVRFEPLHVYIPYNEKNENENEETVSRLRYFVKQYFPHNYIYHPIIFHSPPDLIKNNSVLWSWNLGDGTFYGWTKGVVPRLRAQYSKHLIFIFVGKDEHCRNSPTDLLYQLGWPVFRFHMCKQFVRVPRVTIFPIGPQAGIWEELERSRNSSAELRHSFISRPHWCLFYGSVRRSTRGRKMMVSSVEKFHLPCRMFVFAHYNDPAYLPPNRTVAEILRVKFMLSPKGYVDDTYRLWEALDGGAIPIVQWALYFTAPGGILADAPFPVLRNWGPDLRAVLQAHMARRGDLLTLQNRTQLWYQKLLFSKRSRVLRLLRRFAK